MPKYKTFRARVLADLDASEESLESAIDGLGVVMAVVDRGSRTHLTAGMAWDVAMNLVGLIRKVRSEAAGEDEQVLGNRSVSQKAS